MSSATPTQVLTKANPPAGSFRERLLGMFQAPERPAPPTPTLTETERLAAVVERASGGDLQPYKAAVQNLANKSAGPWDIKVLEQILKSAPACVEEADLQAIIDSRDPTQKVSSAGMENLHVDGTWDVYRTLDCSHLRKLAKQELSRRQQHPDAAA